MDETKEEEKPKEEQPATDTGEGDKPQTTPLIDDANLAAKRMEDANKEKRDLLDREEQLMAKRALGGTTEAGAQSAKKKETDEEYTDRFMAGDASLSEDVE